MSNEEDTMNVELSSREKRKLQHLISERIASLQKRVLDMEPGQQRDLIIEFIKEYQSYWMQGILRETEKKNENMYDSRI